MDPYSPLFAALRPGLEQVKVAIECEIPSKERKATLNLSSLSTLDSNKDVEPKTESLDEDDGTMTNSSLDVSMGTSDFSANRSADPFANHRIYALVTNVESGHEEGCIFVFKRRRKNANQVKIVDGLPILPGFKATIQQVPHSTVDNHSTDIKGPSSDLQIDMSLAGKTISAVSSDTQSIQDLLKVVREAAAKVEELDEQKKQGGIQVEGTADGQPNHHHHYPHHLHHHNHNDSTQILETHTWVENYMDVARSLTGGQAPIFSRFTTSAFAPIKTERHLAPSPAADEVKVSFGTFNVNSQVPDGIQTDFALNSWLHVVEDEPDILIVALEEADTSGLSYVVWTPRVEASWTEAIEKSMGREAGSYRKLACKQLVGILMFVYVRTPLLQRIGSPALASIGVGFGGWAANKGAVAVRFTLDDISICFVASHLSAFTTPEALVRRRWDYHEIIKRLKFIFIDDYEPEEQDEQKALENMEKKDDEHAQDTIESAAVSALREQLRRSNILSVESSQETSIEADHIVNDPSKLQRKGIFDHDVVFWGGDLNFRLELSSIEVKKLIRKRQFESTLLKFDQLRSEMSSKASFDSFHEQEIDFAPTYKFDRGTDVYDTSEKQRCPAWTDRILWKEKDSTSSRVHPINYECAQNIRISDHKPVLATFILRTGKQE